MEARTLRILLIEDNPDDAELLKHEFGRIEKFPHSLICVKNLAEGIERSNQEPFDLVLADLSLPDSHGLETMRRFAKEAPNVAVVVLTGNKDERTAELAIKAGAQDYLVKGEINSRQLSRALRYALERHQSELALRASRAYLNNLIQSSMDVIVASDNERRITLFNEAAEKTFGYSVEEIVGQSVSLLYADSEDGMKTNQAILEQGRWVGEVFNRRKNGETFPSLLAASPVRNLRGEIVGTMGISRDITDQKRRDSVLRESQERFRRAFDDAPIGMGLVSTDGRWLKVNRALCDMLGYSEAELLETNFQSITHADDLAKDLGLIEQVLSGKILSYQMEKRYFHKKGDLVHVMLSVSLVRDRLGAPLYFVSQIENISERKRREAEREKLIHELQEALAHVKTLSGLLPICAWCKKIRDDKGYWSEVERYVSAHTGSTFTHSICPDCYRAKMKEYNLGKNTPYPKS
jgi:PAS domain S-box-containing protein